LRHVERFRPRNPVVLAWVDTRDNVIMQRAEYHEKIRVVVDRRTSFEPGFFLLPVKLARGFAGIMGCTLSGLGLGGHYVAAGAGVAGGIASRVYVWPYLAATQQLGVVRTSDPHGIQTVTAGVRIAAAIVETPLLVLDIPHAIIHGTPLYPVARDHPGFPTGWTDALKSSWRFAVGGGRCPPFPIWYQEFEVAREPTGEEMTGEVKGVSRPTDWQVFRACNLYLDTPVGSSRLPAPEGLATIDLGRLRSEAPGRVLRFTVRAEVPAGRLTHDFEYELDRIVW
jgi:hypothetical protein